MTISAEKFVLTSDVTKAVENYLCDNGKLYKSPIIENVKERKNGKHFSFNEHVRAFIHAQLSNNRPWKPIENNMGYINSIFLHYDADRILSAIDKDGYLSFAGKIKRIKCGNRAINKQLENLKANINKLRKLQEEYSTLDHFVTSRPAHVIVNLISAPFSDYKFAQMGPALAWEYLRNVGVDGIKPDIHIKRLFGANRLGASDKEKAGDDEVIATAKKLAGDKYTLAEVDNIFWSYCAKDYGDVCGANPFCGKCVIKQYCRKR